MEKCISGKNPKVSYFMTDTLIKQKVAYIFASLCFIYFYSSEKNQLQLGKKWQKIQKNFFINLFARKNPERKNFDVIFGLKRSLHKPPKINETMNPICGLGHEI